MDISISCQNGSFNLFLCVYCGWPLGVLFFYKDYPCLCLCLGLEQITIIRLRLRIRRHFSQIFRMEALIFIFVIPYLNSESPYWKKISFLKFSISNCIPTKKNIASQKTTSPNHSNLCFVVSKLYALWFWLNPNTLLQF